MSIHQIKTQAGRFARRIAGLIGAEFVSVDFVAAILSVMDPRQAQEAQSLLRRMDGQERKVKDLKYLQDIVRDIVKLVSRADVKKRPTSSRFERRDREMRAEYFLALAATGGTW